MNVMFAGMIGGWEMVLILAVILVLFGAKKLPELAKGLGTGIKEFKKATREVTDELNTAMDETPPAPRRLPAASVQAQSQTEPQQQSQPQQAAPQSSPNNQA